jgi:hypothetical protein
MTKSEIRAISLKLAVTSYSKSAASCASARPLTSLAGGLQSEIEQRLVAVKAR